MVDFEPVHYINVLFSSLTSNLFTTIICCFFHNFEPVHHINLVFSIFEYIYHINMLFMVNFEHIHHFNQVFLLLASNMLTKLIWCFHC